MYVGETWIKVKCLVGNGDFEISLAPDRLHADTVRLILYNFAGEVNLCLLNLSHLE